MLGRRVAAHRTGAGTYEQDAISVSIVAQYPRFGGVDQRIGGVDQRIGGVDQRIGGVQPLLGAVGGLHKGAQRRRVPMLERISVPVIKHILCPVDFSEASDRALHHAMVMAQRLGARVTLLHAYTTPTFVMPEGAMLPDPQDLTRLSVAAQAKLDETAAKYAHSVVKLTPELSVGAPGIEIPRCAKENDVDLIVMGTHGRTGLGHALLGSIAERVVRTSEVPVLTIREPHLGDKHAQRLTAAIEKILCPVDFSEPSAKALTYAAALARQLGASLHLLHVHSTVDYALAAESYTVRPELMRELKQGVDAKIEELRASVATDGLNVSASTVTSVPYRAIAEAAHTHQADLIVMGTHGRTGFERMLLGSVTERVVRTSAVPVLTVHPES